MYAPTMDWGAGLAGFRAGKQDRMAEDKQTQAMKLQNEASIRANQLNQRQAESHQVAMTYQDEQIQQLQQKNDSFKKLQNEQLKVSTNNVISSFDATNAKESIGKINENLAGMGKPPIKAATYEQTKKSIVEAEGFEMDYSVVVTGEDGKKELKRFTTEQLNDMLRLGGEEAKQAEEAIAQANKTVEEATNEMMPYTVSSEDDSHIVTIENIGAITGADSISPEYRKILEKKAGVFVNPTKTGSTRMDSYTQSMTAFMAANPMPDPKDKTAYAKWEKAYKQHNSDWSTQSVAGKAQVNDNQDVASLNVAAMQSAKYKNSYLNNPTDVKGGDMGDMRNIENSAMTNLTPKQEKAVQAEISTMSANYSTIKSIDDLLADSNSQPVDKDIIANGITYAKKILGKTDEKQLANINWNTKSGILLANYLRATSGTAVAEGEREFLTDVMSGGSLADEKTMRAAITSFRSSLVNTNDVKAGTIWDKAPYSSTLYRQYPKAAGTKPAESSTSSSKVSYGGLL